MIASRGPGRGRGRTARHAPVAFPGDHGGFLGGEYGQTGESDAFAATLHKVLAATSL
jgi:hypothetical protein